MLLPLTPFFLSLFSGCHCSRHVCSFLDVYLGISRKSVTLGVEPSRMKTDDGIFSSSSADTRTIIAFILLPGVVLYAYLAFSTLFHLSLISCLFLNPFILILVLYVICSDSFLFSFSIPSYLSHYCLLCCSVCQVIAYSLQLTIYRY